MNHSIRTAVTALAAAAVLATSALAAGKSAATTQPVPGEDDYRSAAGYHAAAMEHCKEVNRLARGRGGFNVALAREHAAEANRNIELANRHMASYLGALSPDQKGQIAAEASIGEAKRGETAKLASALDQALGAGSPDRKLVASMVTDLYVAERDLVAAHKSAGKTLGIRLATAPHKAGPRDPSKPARRAPSTRSKAGKASDDVGKVAPQ